MSLYYDTLEFMTSRVHPTACLFMDDVFYNILNLHKFASAVIEAIAGVATAVYIWIYICMCEAKEQANTL